MDGVPSFSSCGGDLRERSALSPLHAQAPLAGGGDASCSLHDEEAARLQALHASELLDSPSEEAFDRFTQLVSRLLQCPMSLVSLVDSTRQFFKSAVGLREPVASARQTPFSHSFCQHVVRTGRALIIVDVRREPLVRDNLAISELGVVAYLGIPLKTQEGHVLGSLCAIDTRPRQWSSEDVSALESLAAMVMTEIHLRQQVREHRATNLRLHAVAAERDELVHMLVHDLRNPLSSMLLAIDVVAMSSLEPKQKEILTLAQSSGERLLRMVSDILEVGKAEAGCLQLQLEEVEPATIIHRAHEQLFHLALAAGVSVKVGVATPLPPIKADGEKLRRVLVNLLANAIQHSPPGKEVRMTASLAGGEDKMRFAVEDEGQGVSPDALQRLFEKYAAGSRRDPQLPSTGLGLALCKKVVEAHGGEIGVRSAPKRGTTFWFTLPAQPPAWS